MKHTLIFVFAIIIVTVMSCKPSLPSHVLDEDVMTDILYDYHIAHTAMLQDAGKYDEYTVYENIFKKYDVTRTEFDTSMVYYVRHYYMLKKIYSNVEDRMSKEALAMGGNVQDLTSMGMEFANNGDTTNIWTNENAMLFVPYPPYNVSQFEYKADTIYKAGDRFLLSFDTDFIVQAGRRDLVAMLAVRFQNDSVAYSSQHVSTPTHTSITVSDDDRLGVKSITGFLTLVSDPNDPQTTTKVAIARNLKLIRMHTKDMKAEAEDSVKNDNGNTPTVAKDTAERNQAAQNQPMQQASNKASQQAVQQTVQQEQTNTSNNNGVQETPLGNSIRAKADRIRQQSTELSKKRLSGAQQKPNKN